ncbi:chromosome partitioning protein ParA [bacterium]|nr:MAG: chromosome partitioning protein ParA [bacterium]
MIVATANQKGGVGKTTIAVHCCIWLRENGLRVALVDADVQSSSSVWAREVVPDLHIERLQTSEDILERVPDLASDFDMVVIDGPAGLTEVTRSILLVADLALLPCGPSALDLRAADEAVRVVRQAQKIRNGLPKALLVPNKLQRNYRLSRELLDTAGTLGLDVAPGLGLRQAYADAAGQGTVVWKLGSAAREAAEEVHALFKQIFSKENHEP